MKIKIKNDEVSKLITDESFEFPKYTTQLMNLANSNAQGTRPKVVGQMSDLIQEFSGKNISEWEKWYLKNNPEAIDKATDKVFKMVENFKIVINKIDKKMVKKWVEDLVIIKTFVGLRFQEAILKKIALTKSKKYRLATPTEESKMIDGFIGDIAVSIKPETYKSKKSALPEAINIELVYYKKAKDGITIEYNF